MAAASTTLNRLVLATKSRRELELGGYKREEVISQSNNSSYNKLCTMPVHSRHATTKHELTIPDEIVQRCPILNDMMAAAQVL